MVTDIDADIDAAIGIDGCGRSLKLKLVCKASYY
jgi:hypothetical protein